MIQGNTSGLSTEKKSVGSRSGLADVSAELQVKSIFYLFKNNVEDFRTIRITKVAKYLYIYIYISIYISVCIYMYIYLSLVKIKPFF